MAYTFKMGDMTLPVTPEKLTVKIGNGNKTCTLMNDGEINILKTPGLTEIDFEALLPNVKYNFAVYENGFQNAKAYLDRLDRMKKNKETFQFIVSRAFPNGNVLFKTDMTCSLEKYSIIEDAENTGMDVRVSISLKQYREYGVKKCKVKKRKKLKFSKFRKTKGIHISGIKDNSVILVNNCYTIKMEKTMTLYNLAKKIYGDGEQYLTIAKANKKPVSLRTAIQTGTEKEKKPIQYEMWKKSTKLKKGKKVLIPQTYYK